MRRGRWSVEERNATRDRSIDVERGGRTRTNERMRRLTSGGARAGAGETRGVEDRRPLDGRREERRRTRGTSDEGKEGESGEDDSRVINVLRRARTGTARLGRRENA